MLIIILISLCLCYSILPSTIIWLFKRIDKHSSNNIYLTFDDGPNAVYTDQLLNLLSVYNIKAVFFVVANYAKDNPDIIKRMVDEKHQIALHSLEHRSAHLKGYRRTKQSFISSKRIMEDLGIAIKLYRPPWGHVNLFTLYYIKKYQYKLVLWDVMAKDWSKKSTINKISSRLLLRTANNDIICLHDGRGTDDAPKKMISALSQSLPIFQAQDYQFKLLE